jgi:hypothetical protein
MLEAGVVGRTGPGMLSMLEDLDGIGMPTLSVDPQRREGLATWATLSAEFSYILGGEIRSMTVFDPNGSLRIVAGRDAINREPVLARIAELIAGAGKLR